MREEGEGREEMRKEVREGGEGREEMRKKQKDTRGRRGRGGEGGGRTSVQECVTKSAKTITQP